MKKKVQEYKTRTIAYMRVSTADKQSFSRQEAQLPEADKVYRDRVSGSKKSRPALDEMLSDLREGDTVYILSIDRLSRSTLDLLDIVNTIRDKGANLKSIQDTWLDTTSDNPMSDFLLTVMGALGQMEREMITQRVRDGIDVAKSKGVELGRPKADAEQVGLAIEMYESDNFTVKEITDLTGLSRSTIYNKVKAKQQAQDEQEAI